MKNTTGLYKHQRDNRGKRRKLPTDAPKATLVPVKKYDYELAREEEHEAGMDCQELADRGY